MAWATVSAGRSHTCARRRAVKSLYCGGEHAFGQLGDGTRTDRPSPTQVGTGTSWTTVGAGDSHTCSFRTGGDVRCWGANDRGQAGVRGDPLGRTPPALVPGPVARAVATGSTADAVLAIT